MQSILIINVKPYIPPFRSRIYDSNLSLFCLPACVHIGDPIQAIQACMRPS
eukprot:COSAG06_NODE_5625_length_3352_cov_3.523209_1_plen_51_part_00